MGGTSSSPLVWEDIPLLKYESEIFVQTGAWHSLEQLEESLILHEMFLLYRACTNEFSKNLKALAASQGADVDFDEDWYDTSDNVKNHAVTGTEIRMMPKGFGLGYSAE